MEEKAKRKVKVKNSAGQNNLTIIAIILLFLAVLGAGITIYLQTIPDSSELAFQASVTAIQATNQMALTQIAASSTSAVQQATATENARLTRRASLQMTTTAYVHETEASLERTEYALRMTDVYNTATAAYLIPLVSQTAASDHWTATAQANMLATASYVPPSPTAGFCGYAMYSGVVESPYASAEWRAALDRNAVVYRSARVFYDAFEAQNDCQGGLTPLPYQCLTMEIALDISPQEWQSVASLVNRLTPILQTILLANVCNTPEAQLRVSFFLSETDVRVWEVGRTAILEGYRNGLRGEALWALGTLTGE